MTREEIMAKAKQNGYSRAYASYYADHPHCEACREAGLSVLAGWPHHILTRGAHGPIDKEWNLLSLCHYHHTIADTWAFSAFAPECGRKIRMAKERRREE